jgi:putative DNA-invertase from lambdoid prophage Rac
VSGKMQASARPQFAKLLDKIRDAEALVVTKLDRLGRDAIDVGSTVKTLGERKVEVIVTLTFKVCLHLNVSFSLL